MEDASPAAADSGLERRRQAARIAEGKDYDIRRGEIIRAAAMVFQEKGYRATTLKDVAAALGIDRVTLYRYIHSKEELLREAVTECVVEISREIARISLGDTPPPSKIRMIVEQVMRSYETHYPQPYVFMDQMLDATWAEDSDWARQLVGMAREIQVLVGGVVEQGIHDGDFRADVPGELVVNGLLGMLNWTSRWYRPGRWHSSDEVARSIASVLLDGLSRKPS